MGHLGRQPIGLRRTVARLRAGPDRRQPALLWSASIGNATNYSTPGVGAGRLYVGTRDGEVIAFGSPTTQPLVAPAVSFPATTTGTTSDETLTLTAQSDVTVTALSSTASQFVLGKPSQALPAALAPGQTITVPVSFTPTATGLVGGAVEASLGDGSTYSFALSGTGQPTAAELTASPTVLSMGGTAVGDELSGNRDVQQRRRHEADDQRRGPPGPAVQREWGSH